MKKRKKKKILPAIQRLGREHKRHVADLENRIALLEIKNGMLTRELDHARRIYDLSTESHAAQAHALENTTEYMRELQDRVRNAANILWPGAVKTIAEKPTPPERQPLGQ